MTKDGQGQCAYVTIPRQPTIQMIALTFAYQSRTMHRKAQRSNAERGEKTSSPRLWRRNESDKLQVHPQSQVTTVRLWGSEQGAPAGGRMGLVLANRRHVNGEGAGIRMGAWWE